MNEQQKTELIAEFAQLRRMQRSYFQTRDRKLLEECKALEDQIDIKLGIIQPSLF